MRSALLIRLPFLLLFLCVAAYCQPPGQKINPHTQIRWPINCTGPGHVYNYNGNTCIDMNAIQPNQQIVWPGNCAAAGMVYNLQTNSCFDTRSNVTAGTTTTLPAGSSATVTQRGTFPNYIWDFGIPAGTPGGSLSYPGVVTDNNGGLTMGSSVTSNQPMVDIRHPSFAGGAKCNGINDDTAALQAALNAVPTRGGNILIPSGGSTDSSAWCNIAHPENLTYPTTGVTTLYMSGVTQFGTTWTIPQGPVLNIIGYTGGVPTQFQGAGQSASMTIKPAGAGSPTGTLGSLNTGGASQSSFAVTTGGISTGQNTLTVTDPTSYNVGDWIATNATAAGNYPQFFHITNIAGNVLTLDANAVVGMTNTSGNLIGRIVQFTPSTMTGLVAGSSYYNTNSIIGGTGASITVTDKLTCNITSATRTSNVITATISTQCHIPVGALITVAGASDSTFNGSSLGGITFRLVTNDYVTGRATWKQTGQADATASGGTITGLNEDTVENTSLLSCTSTTCTGVFWRPHTSSSIWGLDSFVMNSNKISLIRDFQAGGSSGTGMVLQSFHGKAENVGAASQGCSGSQSNFGLTYWSSFMSFSGLSITSSCQPWGMRITNPFAAPQGYAGPVSIRDSFIMNGIHADHGGGVQVNLVNVTFDQATGAAVQFDPNNYWASAGPQFSFDNSGYNDNPVGFPTCFVYYEQPVVAGNALGATSIRKSGNGGCRVNEYYGGGLIDDGNAGSYLVNPGNTPKGPIGTYNDGARTIGEDRARQAGLAPAILPYASLPVNTNPSSWTTAGITITTGIDSPDGNANAGRLTVTSGTNSVIAYTYNVTPAVGDAIFYGGWVRTLTNGQKAIGGSTAAAFTMDNGGSSHFHCVTGSNTSNPFDAQIYDDTWHPLVGLCTVGDADGTAGQFKILLNARLASANDYWQPFMIYVPASANIPLRELYRWQKELLHGFVPSGAAAGQLYAGTPISLPADPTSALQAVTKNYVDARVGGTSQVLDFTTSAFPSGIGCSGSAGAYTCTGFPTGTHICTVYLISGGAGGGSGAVEPSGTAAFGGGGGSGGNELIMTVPCNAFGSGTTATVTFQVGAGGAGGTAQSGTGANGNAGGNGTTSYIFPASGFLGMNSSTASGGAGGTTTTGTGGSVASPQGSVNVCAGGAGSSGTASAASCFLAIAGPGGGAGGGGLVAGPTSGAGGAQTASVAQSQHTSRNGTAFLGTSLTGGANTGGAGQTPTYATITPASIAAVYGAIGGTGGGGSTTGNGGAGGAGMQCGAGGGGGGAAINGLSSGPGGNGGDGCIRIIVQ